MRKISVRLTDEEFAYLEKMSKKSKITLSETLRNLISTALYNDSNIFKAKENFVLRKQTIYEINKIGNNINQIAKNNNSHYYTPNEKQKLFDMMNDLKRLLGG